MKNDKTEATKGSESAVKRSVVFLWNELGKPAAWLFIMICVFVSELIGGTSLFGTFWMAVTLFAYFLARIAAALELIAKTERET